MEPGSVSHLILSLSFNIHMGWWICACCRMKAPCAGGGLKCTHLLNRHLYSIYQSIQEKASTCFSCSVRCSYFCQVTMADRSAADRACKDPNPIIDGRKANVNLAYLGAKPRVMQPGADNINIFIFLNKSQKCICFRTVSQACQN